MLHESMNGASPVPEPRAEQAPDRPIFVVGTGRSGSTIFHRIFAEHPELAWQSPLCDLFPARPGLNRMLLKSVGLPLAGNVLKRYLRPGERYRYWEHHCHGFSQPCRDLLTSDVTASVKRKVPPAVAKLVTPKRRRVLIKVTGWPRIGYLRELFPDAKFIHVCRDGRAVANSLLAVDFWRGWRGPAGWRAGELGPELRAEWERHGESFVALAGIQWKLLMTAMDKAAKDLPAANFLQLRYEDFMAEPVACFMRVAKFCELDWSFDFEKAIKRRSLKTANDKWKDDLTSRQQEMLESVLAESLMQHGYQSGSEYRVTRRA